MNWNWKRFVLYGVGFFLAGMLIEFVVSEWVWGGHEQKPQIKPYQQRQVLPAKSRRYIA